MEGDNGIYDWLALTSASSIIVTAVGLFGSILSQNTITTTTITQAIINTLIALGLLFLSAIPWAYFNVGHPLSDRIYQVRNTIAPDNFYVPRRQKNWHSPLNTLIWDCVTDACTTELDDLNAEFVHRYLHVTIRNMIVSDCMTPEFNRAARLAMGAPLGDYTGDKRRFARVYFDEFGRFVGPRDRSVFTPYLRKQLSSAQLESSNWDFDELLITIYEHEQNFLTERSIR
ncbi:MAG: hypothetical protein MRY72_09575 [Aquisalinus sp.]|nr:hypothetical protein [Aquisalinus sp.]